ncbi:MAG: hypothetical protein EXX96DRAFT_562227 [Benjaminiella poitrasii]|nr:MAG: hypothetical protein EXX96DRAFT_562227 [Benjaminiella poitrasii]
MLNQGQLGTNNTGDTIAVPSIQHPGQPVKIRKKPGRKPNPASPALRKAQNRAAQRAFRERKERHMRELEVAIKQIREQRDKLHAENEQLKADQEIMRSENWYLKGIVLTLQLVCFQHNLVIPQHGPYINDQALSVIAQSIPQTISAYISVNASNQLPVPSKLFGYRHTMKQRDRYLSTGSIVITKEGVHSVPERSTSLHSQLPIISKSDPVAAPHQYSSPPDSSMYDSDIPTEDLVHPLQQAQDEDANIPPLSPGSVDSDSELLQEKQQHTPRPVMLTEEPLTSNLAAIQTLRLRLRLQSACVRMDSVPFAIQPTLLQLTIPHDPRIDLVPTPHMRDRMILFRDQFDLDDCFRCLLSYSVFHGGDPAIAANWQLPQEFFEKYWFLTIDYDLRRTTNHWRRLQGLSDLDFKQQKRQQEEEIKRGQEREPQLFLDQATQQQTDFNSIDVSALLGIEFGNKSQQKGTSNSSKETKKTRNSTSYASSLSSESSCNTASSSAQQNIPTSPSTTNTIEDDPVSSFEPVRLTNGYSFTYPPIKKLSLQQRKSQRHHPYQHSEKKHTTKPFSKTNDISSSLINKKTTLDTCNPWDTLIAEVSSNQAYDVIMDSLIDTEQT